MPHNFVSVLAISVCAGAALAGSGGDTCEGAEQAVWGSNYFNTSTATQSSFPAPSEDCPDQFLDWGNSPDRWFVFVPDVEEINLDTCLSGSYDTSLVIYEGDDCNSLVQYACSGDGSGLSGCQAYYSNIPDLPVTPGQTYYIRLGGWNGATGEGELFITPGAGTIPGACCDDFGTCSEGTLADCLDMGGIFAGADTTCADVNCMDFTGACCIGSNCNQISASACSEQSGKYAGDGSICANFDCDDFLGACCAFDACFVGSQTDCQTLGGFFYGYGVECTDEQVECGPDYGACCVGEDCMDNQTQSQCTTQDGEWQGVDTTCSSVVCEGGSGTPGDTCEDAFTAVLGNNPFNTNSATQSSYPPPSESQCTGTYLDWEDSPDLWFRYESTGYGILSLDTCVNNSYDTSMVVYQGDDCASLTQIDCNGDGNGLSGCQAYYSYIPKLDVTFGETYWIRMGGWQGASGSGVLHLSLTNTGNVPGACCMPDLTCVEATGNGCGSVGGAFYPGISCGQIDCSSPSDSGACCIDDTCFYMTGFDCELFAGTFFSVGTSCEDIDCADPVGACCSGDDCFPSTPNSCLIADGEWQGEGVQCDDVMCGCPGDATGDGLVTTDDVLAIISHWGELGHEQWDLDGDGEVAVEDLLLVFAWFGLC